MSRLIVAAALLSAAFPALAGPGTRFTRPRPPVAARPPTPPTPPEPPRAPDDGDDDEEDEDLPQIRPLPSLRGLHALKGLPPDRLASRDDDEDDDDDEDARPKAQDEHGARIYRMERPQNLSRDRRHERWNSDGDDQEDLGDAKAKGRGSARLAVSGPVTLQLRAQAGDIEIVATDKREVTMTLGEGYADDIAIYQSGDRIEATFRGRRELRRGKLRVEVPKGTRIDLASMSGDLAVQRVGGEARIRTMSGDVKLAGLSRADVQTVSGDVHIDDVAGPVKLHTVSGNGVITTQAPAPQLEFESASGSLDWAGACGRDCHVAAETVSGDVKLMVDPKSSFELSYSSHSGELRDEVSLAVKHAPKRKHGNIGGWLSATYGKGEGVIECDAFSGNLVVRKR